MPLLQEAAHIWEDEFRMTAEHKFRGMRDPYTGAGDAYMSFLLTHLVVERWREALLWSWVIGRIGGDDDQWSMEQQMMAWEELGGDPEDVELEVDVILTRRKTLEQDRVARILESSGQMFSKKTTYSFCKWLSTRVGLSDIGWHPSERRRLSLQLREYQKYHGLATLFRVRPGPGPLQYRLP